MFTDPTHRNVCFSKYALDRHAVDFNEIGYTGSTIGIQLVNQRNRFVNFKMAATYK